MPAAWQTDNTKLAAALGLLQFRITTQVSVDSRSGKTYTQFFVDAESVDSKYQLGPLLANWHNGTLEKGAPLHPFLQGIRSEHNYDCMLDAQGPQQRRLRLVGVANGHATEYRDGEELPEMINQKAVLQLADLSLVAALGTLGIPVIKREYNGKFNVYTVPVLGHPLRDRNGQVIRYNALEIAARMEQGKKPLKIEVTDPTHPLLPAYWTRQIHGQLLRHLGTEKKILVVRPEGTQRIAFISENATGRVMDKVNNHFKL